MEKNKDRRDTVRKYTDSISVNAIFEESELEENSTVKKSLTVQNEGN